MFLLNGSLNLFSRLLHHCLHLGHEQAGGEGYQGGHGGQVHNHVVK